MDHSINLPEILRLHGMWRRGENGGKRAYLSGADLSDAYLSDANLSDAYLSDANLSRASLSRADLSDADLSRANLSGANLSDASLSGADLSRSDLSGCNGIAVALARASHIPATGAFEAWKKAFSPDRNHVLIRLLIPAEAARSHGAERKCRAEFADVLEIIGAESAHSDYDHSVIYRVGERVTAHAWDPDRWNTCSGGIHFFLTREEAEDYSF